MDDGTDLAALAAEAAAGSAAAQGRLMATYLPLARARASRLVNDHHSIDDVVQDAFVEVFATLGSLRDPDALPAWVSLAVRKHADRLRRTTRPVGVLDEREVPVLDGVDIAAERHDVQARVRAALVTAPDTDRRLLELRYLADWSVADLAGALGISDGAVRKRLHDARRRLRPALQDLRTEEVPDMTDYEQLLAQVHRPGELRLDDPPAVARPAAREPIATGLKIIDTLAPVARGATVEMVGPVGTGHLVLVVELAQRLNRNNREPAVVAAASSQQSFGAWSNLAKLVTELEDNARHAVVLGDRSEDAPVVVRDAHALARGLAASGVDVLFVVDKATAEAAGGAAGLKDLAGVSSGGGSITLILLDPYESGATAPPDAGMDTRLVFSLEQLSLGIFPALDPVESRATFDRSPLGDELRGMLARSNEIRRYFHQPMVVAQDFTGEAATWIDRLDAEAELDRLLHAV